MPRLYSLSYVGNWCQWTMQSLPTVWWKKVQQFVFIGLLTCALNQPYLSLKSFVGCPKGRCLGCAFRSVSWPRKKHLQPTIYTFLNKQQHWTLFRTFKVVHLLCFQNNLKKIAFLTYINILHWNLSLTGSNKCDAMRCDLSDTKTHLEYETLELYQWCNKSVFTSTTKTQKVIGRPEVNFLLNWARVKWSSKKEKKSQYYSS